MMLRHLVNSLVRHAAQQTMQDAIAGATEANHDRSQGSRNSGPAEVVCAFALRAEAGGLIDLLTDRVTSQCPAFVEHAGRLAGRSVAIIESGVGREAASQAAEDAITIHQPGWIVSAGFAGALHRDLRRGHLIMPSEVVDLDGNCLSIGLKLDAHSIEATPSLHTGRLLTVNRLIRTTTEKRQLGSQHQALACDMESFAIAEVCRRHKTRFLSVRVISDALEDQLPAEIERLLDQKSWASKLGAATGAVFKRPASVKDMWQLKEQALRASDRLAKFLVGTINQLSLHDPPD